MLDHLLGADINGVNSIRYTYNNLDEVNNTNGILLIIQNKFDPDKYYKEIMRDFSDFVIKDEVKAEFLDNNTKLKITYWTNPDNKEITEIIMLE